MGAVYIRSKQLLSHTKRVLVGEPRHALAAPHLLAFFSVACYDLTQRHAVIDNLVKGASGQAIQNLNVMLGVPETTGLLQQALFP